MSSYEIASLVVSVLAFAVAGAALAVARAAAKIQARQHYLFEGSEAAIAWRSQVFDLHDRGLTPPEIRRIMLLEDGGEGYERSNGRIDDILRDLSAHHRAIATGLPVGAATQAPPERVDGEKD